MRLDRRTFIERCNTVHNNKYDYSKVEYVNITTKVCIICPEHGEFWQLPYNHLYNKTGCPECKKQTISKLKNKTTDVFIEEARKIHGDKYDYSKVEYVNNSTKVCIICPEHGEFLVRPNDHLRGSGCPKCAKNASGSTEQFIEEARKIHGDKYDYSKVEYVNNSTKVCIICPEHGEFWQTPKNHKKGQGCSICGYKKRSQNNTYTLEEFIDKANKIHNHKYDYSKSKIEEDGKIKITCKKHGDFVQNRHDHLLGCGCPVCGKTISIGEEELSKFIKEELNIEIKKRERDTIKPYELDLLLSSFKTAIEFDGLIWHSEKYKYDKNYHLLKTEKCDKNGLRLIHVFEDEWKDKQQIVKSMITNLVSKTNNKIYARNCQVKKVSTKIKNEFLDKNHIQGKCNSSCAYGLFYKDELVSLMTFGKPRQQKKYNTDYENTWELMRFCNKLYTNVIGGASKLLSYFVKEKKPNKIITYADRRWSKGNMYFKLGFKHTHNSKPNYFYVINGKRENRFKFRKCNLVKQGYNMDKSEHEIMLERGIYRIYDCGSMVFEKTYKY